MIASSSPLMIIFQGLCVGVCGGEGEVCVVVLEFHGWLVFVIVVSPSANSVVPVLMNIPTLHLPSCPKCLPTPLPPVGC